jgi:AcrR family transcriptional regulator
VLAALNAGWRPHELARSARANAGGVRDPYAVLAVRLSAAELPPPPGQRPPRPPWCGECDERTRMAGFYSDAPNPCPRCKPTAGAQQRSPSTDSPHHLHGGPAQQASIGARAVQRRTHPVHRNDAPDATFDPDPDRSVHAGNDHPGRSHMTTAGSTRVERRRAQAEREILDAASDLVNRHGVAAISMREVAGLVGMRAQSLYEYFPSKNALLDALFSEGFALATERLLALPEAGTADERLKASVRDFLRFCVDNPGRFHLMLQRTVPDFEPSPQSYAVAAASLQVMVDRAAEAGITCDADIDVLRALISGLAGEQIANEPGGDRFIARAYHAVTILLHARRSRAKESSP